MYKRQDPDSFGRPYGTTVPGVLTFRGNPTRSYYGSGPAPVSYTHLRAHETVLDLVCRLLLKKQKKKEQKKKNKNKTEYKIIVHNWQCNYEMRTHH